MQTAPRGTSKSQGQIACLPCRRRKSRCKFEPGSQACLMCRAHEVECVPAPRLVARSQRSSTPRARAGATVARATRNTPNLVVQPRAEGTPPTPLRSASAETRPVLGSPLPPFSSSPTSPFHGTGSTSNRQPLPLDEAEDDSPHIMGPAVASDKHFLEGYLSTVQAGSGARTTRPVVPGVTFTRVQKRPVGVATGRSPSHTKLQISEKLLGPYQQQVVNMYFRKANICFPILDEAFFVDISVTAKGRLSPAVLACLYANSLIYWRNDPELSSQHCPDHRFVWNLALEALYSELHLSPGMPCIIATLLNVGGRPTTTMIGNGMLLGSAISLAHCLGLNRNPIPWDIPKQEKSFRIKIWWCLVIHDRWASLMYGTPPHIREDYHDVPVPKISRESQGNENDEIFEALASLTETLGPYLEQVYSVSSGAQNRHGRGADTLNLDAWTDTLTGYVRTVVIRGTNLDTPGAANLRLCFLATKFFSQRLALNTAIEGTASGLLPDERLLDVRRVVEEIVHFVGELMKRQLGDFWLPMTAFVFSSSVAFLVRLAVQAEGPASGSCRSLSLSLAVDLIASLRRYKEDYGWDLGDICLAQYGEAVDKLSVQRDPVHLDGTWLDSGLSIVSDPAFLDSVIADQWNPLLWDQIA